MPQLTISGAVSGLDTSGIINQLVAVQGNQQNLLRTQQNTQQRAADALSKLAASLATVGTLSSGLARTSGWNGTTVTSSASSVTATATGTTTGTLGFDVTALAAGHTLVSAGSAPSLGTVVASGPLTLTSSDGTPTTIDVGTGTLSDVVAGINAANKGVVANAVQTAPGQYRLQVAATATGASSVFQLEGLDDPAGLNVLRQGADATVTVGSDPATAYQVSSSTNTFTDVLPGVSFTVGRLETGVTVTARVDGSAVADQVGKLVDAVNSVLTQIRATTTYDAATKTGGPLLGDSTTRALQQQLLDVVSGTAAPGVRVTREGTVTFDAAAFRTAYTADPARVAAAFGASTTFAGAAGVTGGVRFSSSTTATRAGTYAVEVTQLATREQWSLAAPSDGQVVRVGSGSTSVSVTVQATDTTATVAAALTAAAAGAGLRLTAADDGGGGLLLTADAPGSGGAFTADVDGVAGLRTVAGQDVQGTVDGVAATGLGAVLAAGGTGRAAGLALDTSGLTPADLAASAGAVGSVTYAPGLMQRLAALADTQTTSRTGLLASAQQSRLTAVKTLQTQIEAWDRRLTDYRAQLTQQFTAMETALARLKSQTTAIAGLSSKASGSDSG